MRLSAALLLLSLVAPAPARTGTRTTATRTFGWKSQHFLLDGKPFQEQVSEPSVQGIKEHVWETRPQAIGRRACGRP